MDPRFQKIAMEKMSRMTPEQLQQISQQTRNISPEAMRRVQEQMSRMSQTDLDNMHQRMESFDPTSIPQASSTFQARQAQTYQGAKRMKDEGNGLLKEGNMMGAVEKYEKAKSILSLSIDKQSSELTTSCSLNIAFCYLKMEMYAQCVTVCSEILKGSTDNLKAVYRRGLAYMHQQKFSAALIDLRRSLELTPDDPIERQTIQEKIDRVEEKAESVDMTEDQPGVEEISVQEVSQNGVDSIEERARQSADVVSQLSDEHIRKMGQLTGMDVNPEMVRTAQAAMKNMDSESLKQMESIVEKMHSGSNASAPSAHTHSPEQIDRAYERLQNNPNMIRKQAEGMTNLSQEELDQLAKMSGGPAGMKLTPEMMQQVSESISQMDDEQLRRLPEAMKSIPQNHDPDLTDSISDPATSSRVSPGDSQPEATMAESSTGAGSPMTISPDMMGMVSDLMSHFSVDDIQSMASSMGAGTSSSGGNYSDPANIERCFTMMKSMDEEMLVNMMTNSGFSQNENQVRAAVRQMRQMDKSQLEMMSKAVAYGQKGVEAARIVKKWLLGRTVLICAIVTIVIAALLRYFDMM